jgi:hypothetical protein
MGTTQNGPAAGEAAAAAVAPDAVTAELLAKHAAGERLTPSGYGKLGAFKAGLKRLMPGKAESPAKSPPAGNGNAPLVGASPSAATSDDGLDPVVPDRDLVRRTTASILKQLDGLARRYVTREARKAGADDKTVSRFDAAAALPGPSQDLMADLSPDVLEQLGLESNNYPVVAFCGALGLWGTNLYLAVDELKRMQKDNGEKEKGTQQPLA